MVYATAAADWAGTDIYEATRIAVGEAAALPPLPLLAERGLGADATGRAGAMLAELPLDISPRAWRLSGRVSRAGRRAADFLSRDLDAFEEAFERARGAAVDRAPGEAATSARASATGPAAVPATGPDTRPDTGSATGAGTAALRLESVGPWTLAARIELPGGRLALGDAGARRDIAESLREGLAQVTARLSSRLGRPVEVMLDEPEVWRVVAGAVPAPSELDPVAPIGAERVGLALSRFAGMLRAADSVSAVLARVPGRPRPGIACHFAALHPAPGEPHLDGLSIAAGDLLAWRGGTRPHGWADGDRDPEAFALLDALAAVLDDGRLAEISSPHLLRGSSTAPAGDHAAAELVAAAIVGLLGQLKVDRMAAVGALRLATGARDLTGTAAGQVAALAATRRVAEVLPRIAE